VLATPDPALRYHLVPSENQLEFASKAQIVRPIPQDDMEADHNEFQHDGIICVLQLTHIRFHIAQDPSALEISKHCHQRY